MSFLNPLLSIKTTAGSFPRLSVGDLKRLPIRNVNFEVPVDAGRNDKMAASVERMLELHKKLADASIPADRDLYERQIEATDLRIDELVYELYELTKKRDCNRGGGRRLGSFIL